MIDLHTHSLHSDGVLIPAELCQRALAQGYRGIAITDHVDASNIDLVVPSLVRFFKALPKDFKPRMLPGMELTHVPPETIPALVKMGRKLGAKIVVVHGETIVEPVPPGTNRAAILAGVDILAHPGLITAEEVKLAAEKGVALEISARKGHSLTNGRVAKLALQYKADLVLNTDSHEPGDLLSLDFAARVASGAGLSEKEFTRMQARAEGLLKRAGGK